MILQQMLVHTQYTSECRHRLTAVAALKLTAAMPTVAVAATVATRIVVVTTV